MKVKVVKVSSGFANVPDNIVLEDYYGAFSDRPGSAYDEHFSIEIPDGFSIEENFVGERMIVHNGKRVQLASINRSKKWVTGVSSDGMFHFEIVNE